MSAQVAPEHVCYVHCNFCNTILAVNVPANNSLLFNIVTVRCGHCANLLSVNIAASLQAPPLPTFQKMQHNHQMASQDSIHGACTSSRFNKLRPIMFPNELAHAKVDQPIINPPEKRQRVPSAYNRFIKEEIQRIKTNNPDISHREAFSAAAKNWAHFPHIRFGLNNAVTNDENKQSKIDHDANFATQHGGAQKSPYFCN